MNPEQYENARRFLAGMLSWRLYRRLSWGARRYQPVLPTSNSVTY